MVYFTSRKRTLRAASSMPAPMTKSAVCDDEERREQHPSSAGVTW